MKVLLGIGNELMSDDFVGCYIARKFKKKGWVSIDCGTVPENFIFKVKKLSPELVIIVDATSMGLEAGEIRRVPKDKISKVSFSTHNLPLNFLIDFLEKFVPEVILIGIQPKTTDFGSMSSEIKKSAERLLELLTNDRINAIPSL